ncbi:MAG: DUF86 domain-containing protein [Nitrospinae bacterium]|nr:DUF86 domain-containing protein [Nitrospinota bacterium]MBF0633059.1 DUF86 domain-containing protein [Nitrospinota bacterium]
MTHHDETIRVRHMLDYAREAVEIASGKTVDDLAGSRVTQLALTRAIEIIGEAASKVSGETRAKYPAIPWDEMIGMRNRLIHGYDSLDIDIISATVLEDLPMLISQLEKIIPDSK